MSVQLKESDSAKNNHWVPRYTEMERSLHWVLAFAFFPLVFTGMVLLLPVFRPLAQGEAGQFIRVVHRIFAVVLVIPPILYLIFRPRDLFTSLGDMFAFGRGDAGWIKAAIPYYLGGRRDVMPPQGRFNAGEKLNAIVTTGAVILFAITGFIMWFGKGSVSPGVFQTSVIIHDLTTAVAATMVIVHLYLALAHPLMCSALVGMRFGKVTDSYAREHHAAWYYGEEKAWQMFEEGKAAAAPAAAQQSE